MKRRQTLALGAALAAPGLTTLLGSPAHANTPTSAQPKPSLSPPAAGERVLRYAFQIAETGFDPAGINDTYSRTVTSHIFEALYAFDYLARPAKIVPVTADGMPQTADEFRTWTFKVKPGIFFADDPAFKGQQRELVAADYLFSFKRFADPAVKSPLWASVENWKVPGLAALRKQALDSKKPFDYDAPIAGMQLIDRYTFQLRLEESRLR